MPSSQSSFQLSWLFNVMPNIYTDQENQKINHPKTYSVMASPSEETTMQPQVKRSALGSLCSRNFKLNSAKNVKLGFLKNAAPAAVQRHQPSFKIHQDNKHILKAVALPFVVHTDEEENPSPKLVVKNMEEAETEKCGDFHATEVLELPKKRESSLIREFSPVSSRSDKDDKESSKEEDVYAADILYYLKNIEENFIPKANYMMRQPDITYNMRSILVDWLVDVGEEYTLNALTLHLAVNFIDRFLSVMSVVRGKLQLLGTAAIFIAAKYEEIYPPEVKEFVFITDDTYTTKQVFRMEYLIMKVLHFDISCPTTITFLNHFTTQCDVPKKVAYLAQYLCELALLEGDPYYSYRYSMVASSALALANHCTHMEDVWPEKYTEITGYTIFNLDACLNHLSESHAKADCSPHGAIFLKYSTEKYLNVSSIPPSSLDVSYWMHMTDLILSPKGISG